jgi:hypothetical protein
MLIERKVILNEDQSIGYIEAIFNSDNVMQTTYFPESQRLYIAFNRGTIYSYGNFDENLYNEFENSKSQGKFFQARINKNKAFPYRKEYNLLPYEISKIKNIIEENKIDENELS